MDAHCVGVFPAENPAALGQSVNVMAAFACRGPAREAAIRCYGSDGQGWKPIFEKRRSLPEDSHVHLYFTLPAACFSPENWGGRPCEELSIWFGEDTPSEDIPGILLYFQ